MTSEIGQFLLLVLLVLAMVSVCFSVLSNGRNGHTRTGGDAPGSENEAKLF
jgi:hypothetical protein